MWKSFFVPFHPHRKNLMRQLIGMDSIVNIQSNTINWRRFRGQLVRWVKLTNCSPYPKNTNVRLESCKSPFYGRVISSQRSGNSPNSCSPPTGWPWQEGVWRWVKPVSLGLHGDSHGWLLFLLLTSNIAVLSWLFQYLREVKMPIDPRSSIVTNCFVNL